MTTPGGDISSVVTRGSHGWSFSESADRLHELCYFERACANVRAGWIARVPELDLKLALGHHLHQSMEHATDLRMRLNALARFDASQWTIPRGWQEVMIRTDALKNSNEMLVGLYMIIGSELIKLYEQFLADADIIADEPSRRLINRILLDARVQLSWAKAAVRGIGDAHSTARACDEIKHLWKVRHTTALVAQGDILWNPQGRMPQAARPHGISRGVPGALRIIPKNPLSESKDIGIFLHGFLNEEIATMELVARNTYEHPDMPWQFHSDMAKHSADEARHAELVARAASSHGVKYGDYPIYTSSYDAQYQFEPCAIGSKKELLWRLLLRQTFHEGLALDALSFEVKKREMVGQTDLADMFRYLLADEIFHAQSGLKWSRYLCNNDASVAMLERERAHEFFVERVKQSRARFVAEHMEDAIREIEHLEEIDRAYHLPIHRTLNLDARKRAGFMDEEIEQIVGWGYVER
jgi:uncharacterized ferritin-like protein (DUF455 family)